jgi:RNA polymerase sigma-70 factor (ECF subfamily)
MRDMETEIRRIVDGYAALIRKVIQDHLFTDDAVDPQDIEQEIRIKLWKSLRKGKKIDKLPSYLKKVAYTATMDELRRLKKQAPYRDVLNWDRLLHQEDGSRDHGAPFPERGYDRKQRDRIVEEKLEKIGPDRRRVLRLYATGLSVDEICEICGWDRIRVRHLLYRGIDDLRRLSGAGTEGATESPDGPDQTNPRIKHRTGKEPKE